MKIHPGRITIARMGKNLTSRSPMGRAAKPITGKPSALLDTRIVYCGDNLEQLAKLPGACVNRMNEDSSPVVLIMRCDAYSV